MNKIQHLIILSSFLSFSTIALAARLPTVRSIEEILAEQIQLIIDAGHLRPLKCDFEQHCGALGNYGFAMDEYWTNPAEMIYTIAIAIPHLPDQLQTQAKEYLKLEFEHHDPNFSFPPYKYIKMNGIGAHRQYQDTPAEFYSDPDDPLKKAEDYEQTYGIRYAMEYADAVWKGWSYNPFNLYACWKYAEIFPDQAQKIFDQVKDKIGALPADEAFLKSHPHVINQYIAGYHGYLGLERLLGQLPSSQVQGWLDDALQKRISLLEKPTPEEGVPLYGVEAGGFLYLVPELGQYLFEHARQAVEEIVTEQNWGAPYWHISRAEEVSRYDPNRGYMEGYHQHLFETASQFQVRALALKWERQRLERYLDVPAVWRGDLFYIQNIVATLEAPGDPPEEPLPWTEEPLTSEFDGGFSDQENIDLDGSILENDKSANGKLTGSSGCGCGFISNCSVNKLVILIFALILFYRKSHPNNH